ncbi:MAG: hypothetical protein ACT4N2_10510 [Hyphomicrobium sp.]
MTRTVPLALLSVTAALAFAATSAPAAPAAGQLTGEYLKTAQAGSVELVHNRRWHRGRHWRGPWYPRRCHFERYCWWDRWGYRHCDLVRRCYGPRW